MKEMQKMKEMDDEQNLRYNGIDRPDKIHFD